MEGVNVRERIFWRSRVASSTRKWTRNRCILASFSDCGTRKVEPGPYNLVLLHTYDYSKINHSSCQEFGVSGRMHVTQKLWKTFDVCSKEDSWRPCQSRFSTGNSARAVGGILLLHLKSTCQYHSDRLTAHVRFSYRIDMSTSRDLTLQKKNHVYRSLSTTVPYTSIPSFDFPLS